MRCLSYFWVNSVAEFRLDPVPRVLVVQAVIFLANTWIVKKLMIDPYLQLRTKRLDYTERKKEQANQRLIEVKQQLAELEARRQAKLNELAELRRQKQTQARNQREEIIRTARQQAEKEIKRAKDTLDNEFQQAQQQLVEVKDQLGQQVLDKLLA